MITPKAQDAVASTPAVSVAPVVPKVVPVVPLQKKANSDQLTGVLDTSREGHGVVRASMCGIDERDAYIAASIIRRYNLRPGDTLTGPVREPTENER